MVRWFNCENRVSGVKLRVRIEYQTPFMKVFALLFHYKLIVHWPCVPMNIQLLHAK